MVKIGWERLYPRLQFFSYEGFEDYRKSVFRTFALIPSGFIYKRNDPYTGEATHQNFALLCDMHLIRSQSVGCSGRKNRIAKIS